MSETLRVRLTVPAVELPLSLSEVRAYLGIGADDTAADALLAGYIRSATGACQAYTGRALITQGWTLALDAWPEGARAVELPFPPLQTVSQVTAYDEIDQALVWSATSYFVDTVSEPGRLVPRDGAGIPHATRAASGIEIQFHCGYGDHADSVPQPLRDGLLACVTALHDCGGMAGAEDAARACSATALWRPFRVMGL